MPKEVITYTKSEIRDIMHLRHPDHTIEINMDPDMDDAGTFITCTKHIKSEELKISYKRSQLE